MGSGSKKMQLCNPHPEHIEQHAQVVKEMKERDEHYKIQVREVVKRSLESGQPDDVIDAEKFGKRARMSNNGTTRPFNTVRKREEVDIQWAIVAVVAALPMCFFNNTEVRKDILMTSE